jgi:exosortase
LYVALACFAGAGIWLYSHVAAKLVQDWATDGNYSHGFLIPPIAAYLAWERRAQLAATPLRPANAGLLVVAASLSMLIAGVLGAEHFVARVSMIGVLTGTIVFAFGWAHLWKLAGPMACLLLMIPLPAIVFNQIAFPLQLFASHFGSGMLSAAGIPVLREGNVIVLANTSLEVAEACSGIRSLVSLVTVGVMLGYFGSSSAWIRALITLSTVPVAVLTNGMRIAGTGIAAHYYGPSAAEGFFHTFSGWLVFLVAVVMVWMFQRICQRFEPVLHAVPA